MFGSSPYFDQCFVPNPRGKLLRRQNAAGKVDPMPTIVQRPSLCVGGFEEILYGSPECRFCLLKIDRRSREPSVFKRLFAIIRDGQDDADECQQAISGTQATSDIFSESRPVFRIAG